jgi:tetratricopeptide (TPR) repeat protein
MIRLLYTHWPMMLVIILATLFWDPAVTSLPMWGRWTLALGIGIAMMFYYLAFPLGIRYTQLGVRAYREGRYTDAIRHYRRIFVYKPNHSLAWLSIGLCCRAMNDWGQMQFAMSQALATNPRLWTARHFLAEAFMWSGHYESAQNHLTIVLQEQPNYSPARLLQARLQRARGETAAAEETLQGLPAHVQPQVLFERACLAAVAGETDRARSLLQEACDGNGVTVEDLDREEVLGDLRDAVRDRIGTAVDPSTTASIESPA